MPANTQHACVSLQSLVMIWIPSPHCEFQTDDSGQWLLIAVDDGPLLLHNLSSGERLHRFDSLAGVAVTEAITSDMFLTSTALFVQVQRPSGGKDVAVLVEVNLKTGLCLFIVMYLEPADSCLW